MSLCRVSVAIAHYFRETSKEIGYGSSRVGARLARQVALSRCLGSVLGLGRLPKDVILNMAEQVIEVAPSRQDSTTQLEGVVVDVHLFVTGDAYLQEICDYFAPRITLHRLELEDPRTLPMAASHWLRHQQESDAHLHVYLEDDLIIQDPYFFDKQVWFTERTQHQFVLMPHRLEPCLIDASRQLCVDGPVKLVGQEEQVWSDQEQQIARGTYWDGRSVGFALASNPHSGSFCLSERQRQHLKDQNAVPNEFVGPLETAATGTVWQHFPVWKPMWPDRDFLSVEHGHPSFLGYIGTLPVRHSQQESLEKQ